VWALAEAGAEVPGFDLALSSDVPSGAGLSSSAALQVAVVTALDALLGLGLDARARAALAQRSENGFVGVRCGILDPWASALCEPGAALRIDCATQSARSVPLPVSEIAILLTDSGVRRELADGAYNLRVEECARALAEARRAGIASAQASSLSELDVDDLGALESTLDSQLLRRVRHVLTENARVDAFEAALRVGSLARAGELLCESQRSLRDDYEVSIPELDVLCELGEAQPGVHGSRLTGAGFGGCVLHLAAATQAEAALEGICSGFERRFARRPRSWVLRSGRGASALDVPG
jgi:galactokinase